MFNLFRKKNSYIHKNKSKLVFKELIPHLEKLSKKNKEQLARKLLKVEKILRDVKFLYEANDYENAMEAIEKAAVLLKTVNQNNKGTEYLWSIIYKYENNINISLRDKDLA